MGSLGPSERLGQYGQTISFPSQSQTSESSPRDSPPIAKKRVCRVDGGKVGQISAMRSSSALPKHFTFDNQQILTIPDGKENTYLTRQDVRHSTSKPSIFSRVQATANVVSAAKTFTRLASPGSKRTGRRIHFSPHVTVYHMDENGPICTECAALNTEPRDRQAFMSRWMNKSYQKRISGPIYTNTNDNASDVTNASSSPADGKNVVTVRMPPSPPSDAGYVSNDDALRGPRPEVLKHATPNRGHEEPDRNKIVNYTFIEDPHEGVKLKFVLPLGMDYSPNDVVVKANMSGNRIRVIANKVLKQSNGSHVTCVTEQFNERYQVPIQVDPYKVSARLDIKGNLTVEAPLLNGLDKRVNLL